MTGENSTLEDIAEELKAAQEKVDDSAAFPTDMLNKKNKEMLENNPVDNESTNGKEADADEISKKRKLENDNHTEDEPEKEKMKTNRRSRSWLSLNAVNVNTSATPLQS